jgi:hypothetical protein
METVYEFMKRNGESDTNFWELLEEMNRNG